MRAMFSLLYGLYEYLFRKVRAVAHAPARPSALSPALAAMLKAARARFADAAVRAPQTEVRLLLLGLDRAGKTSVLERLKALHAPPDAPPAPHAPTLPTVGARPRAATPRNGATRVTSHSRTACAAPRVMQQARERKRCA